MHTVTVASAADFIAYYGVEPPDIWLGLCCKRGEKIVGLGCVIWNDEGRAMGFIDKREPVSEFLLHRGTRKMMKALKDVGEPAVYVMCDERFPNAAGWLRRLGFVPEENNPEVWRAELAWQG